MATVLCFTRWGRPRVILRRMKFTGPPSTELLQCLTEYITWPWSLTCYKVGSHVTWCHLGGQDLCEFEVDMIYCFRVRMTTIFHLYSPNFYVFLVKRGQISNFIFLPPKGCTLARMAHFEFGGVSKDATCGPDEEAKKEEETFMHQTGYLPKLPMLT